MYPKEFCKYKGRRKELPKKERPKMNNIMLAKPKFLFFKILRSTIGCFTVNSAEIKITKATKEIAKQVRIKSEVQPPVFHAAFPSD